MKDSEALPNLFLIGAARSATTSIAKTLSSHHDVYLPQLKEPHFLASYNNPNFGRDNICISDFEKYTLLYKGSGDKKYRLDASTSSMYHIDHFLNNASEFGMGESKIIVVLRNPVERAISHYRMLVRRGIEKRDPETALLAKAPELIARRWGFDYLGVSNYCIQLHILLNSWRPEKIKVFLFEDLSDEDFHERLTTFLDRDENNFAPLNQENDSTMWSNNPLYKWTEGMPEVRKKLGRILPPTIKDAFKSLRFGEVEEVAIPEKVKQKLNSHFAEEIATLEDMLNCDLSHWKK
jgi:hypothetical protein